MLTAAPPRSGACSRRPVEGLAGPLLSPALSQAFVSDAPRRGSVCRARAELERAMGIEPTRSAWKADVLPLNYAREGTVAEAVPGSGRPRRAGGARGRGGWGKQDSNLRRLCHQIYSLAPLAARVFPRVGARRSSARRARDRHLTVRHEIAPRSERSEIGGSRCRRIARTARGPTDPRRASARGGRTSPGRPRMPGIGAGARCALCFRVIQESSCCEGADVFVGRPPGESVAGRGR